MSQQSVQRFEESQGFLCFSTLTTLTLEAVSFPQTHHKQLGATGPNVPCACLWPKMGKSWLQVSKGMLLKAGSDKMKEK